MNIRTLAVNGVLAALYIAVTMIIQPFASRISNFDVPEMFNHLIVFNKKYFIGIVIGVFFSNLFFSSLGVYDLSIRRWTIHTGIIHHDYNSPICQKYLGKNDCQHDCFYDDHVHHCHRAKYCTGKPILAHILDH